MGVGRDDGAAHRSASEPLYLHLAPGGSKRMAGCGADDFGVVAVRHDHPAAIGPEVETVEDRAIDAGRNAPIEPVAKVEIVGPLAVTHKVRTAYLDLDDHDPPLRIDTHQIGPASVAQRHFSQAPDVVSREEPANSARDGQGVMTFGREGYRR